MDEMVPVHDDAEGAAAMSGNATESSTKAIERAIARLLGWYMPGEDELGEPAVASRCSTDIYTVKLNAVLSNRRWSMLRSALRMSREAAVRRAGVL